MIIVRISGGLGNQMFQYMFGLTLGNETLFDLSFYNHNNIHNGFELEKIFKIKVPICSNSDKIKLVGREWILFKKRVNLSKIEAHFFGKNFVCKQKKTYIKQLRDDKFHNEYLDAPDEKYFDGNWASELYFKKNIKLCSSVFIFPEFSDKINIKISDKIKKTNSVSLHIRRGDFVKEKRCVDMNFWFRSIEKIKDMIPDPQFFVFSDDINYCKEKFKNMTHITFVDNNGGSESYRDMQLMALCKNNIIANSTFSWWAAYLNKNINKIVICPRKSPDFKDKEDSDYFCDTWIKI